MGGETVLSTVSYSFYIHLYFSPAVRFHQMPEKEMSGNVFYFAARESKIAANKPVHEAATIEARIVERVVAGEQTAFDELYKMFAPMVHGIILARVPRDEAPDLVQDVFVSAYKNMHSLRDRNAVGAWLAAIARNLSNNFYRQAKPTEELPEEISDGGRSGRHETEAREILALIQTMPDVYKETLILRLVEGMTGQEIARRTGLTPESVRVNLHRGMKMLRARLGGEERK